MGDVFTGIVKELSELISQDDSDVKLEQLVQVASPKCFCQECGIEMDSKSRLGGMCGTQLN